MPSKSTEEIQERVKRSDGNSDRWTMTGILTLAAGAVGAATAAQLSLSQSREPPFSSAVSFDMMQGNIESSFRIVAPHSRRTILSREQPSVLRSLLSLAWVVLGAIENTESPLILQARPRPTLIDGPLTIFNVQTSQGVCFNPPSSRLPFSHGTLHCAHLANTVQPGHHRRLSGQG